MRLAAAAGLALLLLGAPAAEAAPEDAYRFPAYRSAAQVKAACDSTLADLKRREAQLERSADDATLLAAIDDLYQRAADTFGPLALISAVHPDKSLRDAADACDLRADAFNAAFLQNRRVHAKLKQLHSDDPIDQRLRSELLDNFEDSGVALAPAARSRAREIVRQTRRLSQDFDRRVQEDRTRVAFGTTELDGVPEAVLRGAALDAKGRVLLGIDYPSAGPVLEQATNAAARERMWRASMALGGEGNLKTLARLATLRREYARLFGFDSYADLVLRRRMARSEDKVQAFLGEVQASVAQRELADLAALREAKAAQLGSDAANTTLRRWDVPYYTERVRQTQFAVEQAQFRRHFPPEASLLFVMRLAERLFGIRFEPVEQPLWHAEARAFVVHDGEAGPLGTLFVDLYPRADKYNHAAVWSFRDASARTQRRPAVGLVVNVDRQGLSIEELETLLHEFGHALHALLSTTRHATQGGTNVLLDFVEAPSQMLEDWVYDPQVLRLFAEVCAACEPVPDELIAKARAARGFGRGIQYARQHLYASYDLALHGKQPEEPMALWARMEGGTPLGFVPGSMLPASFGHVVGGYAAGYYGYLWSEVTAFDLRSAFDGKRLDAEVGRRYRDRVLARGGERAPDELLADFLGRPARSEAFFRYLNEP